MRRAYTLGILTVLAIALALSFTLSGCNRKIDSLDPVRALPDPLHAPINLTALIGIRAVTLNWEMPVATGVSFYRIYVADSLGGEFQLRDTSHTLSRTIGGLSYNHQYVFAVAAVRSTNDEGDRSFPISVQVPALSLVINGDAEYANSRNVQIALNAGIGATEYQISEDSSFATAPILGYSNNVSFELSSGEVKKRVYARFYYSDGSRTNAAVYDEITLDMRASISLFEFLPVQTSFQTGETITFELTSGELKGTASVSFIGAPLIPLYDDGFFPDAVANDGKYTGRWLIPVGVSSSGTEVSGSFTDAAGNEALPYKASEFLNIVAATEPVTIVSTFASSTYQILVNWTASTSPNFQAYRLYRALNSNVSTTSTLVTSIFDKPSSGYTDTTLSANTKYFYRVYVIDSFGYTAASNVDSAQTLVNTAPTAVSLAGSLAGDSAGFDLSWTISSETDFASYRIYRRNSPGVTTADLQVKIVNERNTDSASDQVAGSATVYYRIFVFDRHGLSTGSNEISLTK